MEPRVWSNDLNTRLRIRAKMKQRVEFEFANPYHSPSDGRFTTAMDGARSPGGGATIEITGEAVKTGYMVGVRGHSSITPVAEFFAGDPPAGRKIIADWLKANKAVFRDKKIKVGIWHDEEHGEIVLDPAEQFTDRGRALVAGRFRNQQGIFHIDNNEYIETGGTGDR